MGRLSTAECSHLPTYLPTWLPTYLPIYVQILVIRPDPFFMAHTLVPFTSIHFGCCQDITSVFHFDLFRIVP